MSSFSTYRNSLAHSSSDSSFATSSSSSAGLRRCQPPPPPPPPPPLPPNNIGGSGGDHQSAAGDDGGGGDNSSSGVFSMSSGGGDSSLQQQQQQPSEQQQAAQTPTNSGQPSLTLLQAVISGDVRKVRKMVVKGVSAIEANERDPQGRTPLSIACSNGMVLTVEFLSFIPEIDPNKSDNEGNTPLLLAAQAGHVDCVRILLKEFRNVKLDHQNRKGYTALIQAAINGRTDCAKILMEAGANPFFADKVRKKNALQWAEFCGRGPCASMIKEMSGRFPALVRHLVQAGQSVLTRHRSIWGSDGEIDRIAEREQLAAKSQGGTNERRGTISRLLQRSAKWIRSLSKRRKPNYKSLGALVSVGLAISGPAVTKQILDKSQLAEEEQNKSSPHSSKAQKTSVSRLGSTKAGSRHGPQSPPWQIPEVQIIAPSDEFCGRYSIALAANAAANGSSSNSSNSNSASVAAQPPAAAAAAAVASPVTVVVQQPEVIVVVDTSAAECDRSVIIASNEAWGQHASAPTSPVLSSRSAERAHRRRFAQRAAATTSRQHGYHHAAGPTAYSVAYHDTVLAAAEHLNAIAAAEQRLLAAGETGPGDAADYDGGGGDDDTLAHSFMNKSISQDESSIEEEDEMAAIYEHQQQSSNDNSSSSLIFTYNTCDTTNYHHQQTAKKPY